MTVAILIGYLALLFVVAAWSARRTTSNADYYIAGGKLGWLLGGATLAATHASAGTFIGTIGVVYSIGWSFAWLIFSIPIAYWFLAAILAPRFATEKHLTLPSFLESRYRSANVRSIAAAILILASVVYVQAQVVAGGLVAHVVFDIEPLWGMVGFTLVLVCYTMIGGMLAVVYTDLLQLAIMFGGAVLALPFAIGEVGGFGELLRRAQQTKPDVFDWNALPVTLLLTMGLAFTLGSISSPQKLIRLYAMKDLTTIRRGTLFAIATTLAMNLAVMLLALVSLVLFPELQTGDLAMPVLAREVLPPLLGSFLLAAVTAAMMSTVDSLLLVASSALSEDLFARWRPQSSEQQRSWVRRAGVIVTGSVPLALLLAGWGEGELVQFIVLLFTALMASCFLAPVVGGVFWRGANAGGATSAMIAGLIACMGWKTVGPASVDPVLPGVLVSCFALWFGSSISSRLGSQPTS